MNIERARELAAQAWCLPETRNKPMDVELANAFADILVLACQQPSSPDGLRDEITTAVNRHSAENASNTPDFVLGEYLTNCLAAFDKAVNQRESWYGRSPVGHKSKSPTS